MSSSRRLAWMVGTWMLILVIYSALSLLLKRSSDSLNTFGNIVQCIVPLLANAGLLLNAGTPHWRRNIFWMLLAMGCSLWMLGQFEWTYYEVYMHQYRPVVYGADIVFFLKGIPIMAALALQPHRKRGEVQLRYGYLDFISLLTWWMFLYAFAVFPWMYPAPSEAYYNYYYDLITNIQNMVIVVGLGLLWLNSKGAWRIVYANLFGSAAMYMLSSLTINVAISLHRYSTGSVYDLPLISAFLWFGLAGVIAYQRRAQLDAPSESGGESESGKNTGQSVWAARLAMAALLSLPLFAIYVVRYEQDTSAVRDFRLMTTLVAAVPLALLVFLRMHIADRDRVQLLAKSQQSVENLQRLQ